MHALAIVLERPEHLELRRVELSPPGPGDVVVEVEWSGISTGTERLLWSGQMPPFPGMGYPLVPGYESVGRIVSVGPSAGRSVGERVFVPGAKCFGGIRGLFGGAASRLVVPAERAIVIDPRLEEQGALLALAATAHHALAAEHARLPDLIVGHGVLGRLLARIAVAQGGQPVVWERDPTRADGARGYVVLPPNDDPRRDYDSIYDVSGDSTLLDSLVSRLARGGEVVLAGFYGQPVSFSFPPAFMKEARFRVAAEWQPADLEAVNTLLADDRMSLDGLITHREPAERAEHAYRTAFEDPRCLKMLIDWRASS